LIEIINALKKPYLLTVFIKLLSNSTFGNALDKNDGVSPLSDMDRNVYRSIHNGQKLNAT
jgi:hypothetical protein